MACVCVCVCCSECQRAPGAVPYWTTVQQLASSTVPCQGSKEREKAQVLSQESWDSSESHTGPSPSLSQSL
jgi:hypothetical protein